MAGDATQHASRHIRRCIDIQLTIDGYDEIGWKSLGDCAQPAGAFDAAKDIVFFSDRPESWVSLPAGHFAIFFPDDAHAPLAGRGTVKKAIMKIAVE
jgi:YhcH/YjgK/YiaL family protein